MEIRFYRSKSHQQVLPIALDKNSDLVVRSPIPQMLGHAESASPHKLSFVKHARHTGTGKTLAFLIPAIEAPVTQQDSYLQALAAMLGQSENRRKCDEVGPDAWDQALSPGLMLHEQKIRRVHVSSS